MSLCVLREAVKTPLFPLKVSSRVSTNQLLPWEKQEYSEKGRDMSNVPHMVYST